MENILNKQVYDQETIALILQAATQLSAAQIAKAKTNPPFGIQKIVLDLTTAKRTDDPYKIAFPFRSFYVADATDNAVTIDLQPNIRDDYQSSIPIKKNDSWTSSEAIGSAYLSWSAQSAKSITIVFFVDSEFKSGSQISVNSGGISINEGTAVANTITTLVAAAAAVAVLPQSSTRFVGTIQNKSGASIWLGPAGVTATGATEGFELQAGGLFIWKNTAALYAFSAAGGRVLSLVES